MFKASKTASAVRLVIAMGAATVAFSTTAVAQEQQKAADSQVERIQVTGSSIKRTDVEGALPVQTLSRDDIDKTGLTTAGDLIQSIPSMQGFTTDSESVGGGGGGQKTASLRGLGSEYTLVLINGRRLAPSGSGSTIDLNAIPLAAIERVEVLTDGASALYGSDAIAGVVNFITKSNYEGASVAGRYTRPQESGGKSDNLAATFGYGDLDKDGFNVLFSVSRDTQAQLKATDREFAKTGIIPFRRNNKDYYYVAGSPNAIPGNARWVYTGADGKNVTSAAFNPYLKQNGKCAPSNFEASGLCQFDYTSTIEIAPENTRDSYMFGVDFAPTDDLKFFVDAMYSDFSMIARIAPNATGFFPIPKDSQIVKDYVLPYIPADQAAKLVRVDAQWRALPIGNRATEYNTKSTNLVAGFETTIGDLDLSGALNYGKNDSDENIAGGYPDFEKFMAAVGSGKVNIFDTPDKISAEGLSLLQASQYYGNWENSSTDTKGADVKASMPVFELPGGQVYVGSGLEYRKTHFVNTLAQANKDDLLLGIGTGTPYDMKRNNFGGFMEMIAPVTDTIELTGAVRYDSIGAITSDGSKVNDSVHDVTYKLSARWNATDDLIVRASTGTGFKAPSMLAIGRPRVEFGVTSAPYECPFKGTNDPLAALCNASPQQFEAFNQGNTALKPEESKQYTVGFVYAPDNNFSFGIDYWNIEMTNLITSVTESQIFQNPQRYRELFTTKLNKATQEQEIAIIFASVNVGKSENSGLDWDMMVGNDYSFGRITTSLGGTYLIDSQYTRPGTTDDWISSLGRYGDDNAVMFRNVIKSTTTLTHGDFSHSLIGSYRSGYEDQAQVASARTVRAGSVTGAGVDMQLAVPSYVTWNYQANYNVMADLKVTVGVNNLTDKAPPLSLRSGGAGHQVGFDPRYTDVYGRTFYVGFDYKFM